MSFSFFNSEIFGKATGSSFGVIFRAAGETVPRHPTQLYEAFGYIFVFLTLWFLYWKGKKSKQTGFLFGLFLVLLMTVRLFVERFKIEQVVGRDDWILGLNTGQVLSIPFILIGLYFMFLYKTKKSSLDKWHEV